MTIDLNGINIMRQAITRKKWAILTLSLAALLVFIGLSTHLRKAQILKAVMSTSGVDFKVIDSASSEGVLFGDSSYVWRLNLSGSVTNLGRDASLSDLSDLNAAVDAIKSLLSKKVDEVERRAVLRKDVGSWSVYIVTGDHPTMCYLLVFTM